MDKSWVYEKNWFGENLYGEMKRGRKFPSVTSGQLHSAVTSLTTSASKRGRGRTRGVSLEKSLGSVQVWKLSVHIRRESVEECLPLLPPYRRRLECWSRADSDLINKWADVPTEVKEYIMDRVLDHFDLDYTRHEDKFLSKEAALLKPHPDTTKEQWKELCDLFTSEAFMKRSEQNKKNRSKLTVNHAAGSRSFQRTRACMKNQESGNINPAELYKKNYTNKDGFGPRKEREKFMTAVKPPPSSTLTTQSSDLQHQLVKARDEIEAMRAARERLVRICEEAS
ncbi:hypothetical protein CJ030_MR4G013712 [Morella rubra]|uniref:Uncharacterized protein n=1 Tax=Morella rubra TaxID=262757 RepID=A0A6A1X007_9ROSI|nr:hypothetical protein CJ030_MR4G013712 [Morella rubra]